MIPQFQIPFHELEFTYARSGGPGGQNVNKTNSAAILRWNVLNTTAFPDAVREHLYERLKAKLTKEGDVLIRSDVHRDQDQNRSECIRRLHDLIRKSLFVPKKRTATKPTRSSVRKRLDSKRIHSEVKNLRKKVEN